MNKSQTALLIVLALLIIAIGYIATEKVNFCETAKNESYTEGYNNGNEDGFNQGYYNGSRDYLIALNQKNVFPCLNFQSGEYNEISIGGLCQQWINKI